MDDFNFKPDITESGADNIAQLFGSFDFGEITDDIVSGSFSLGGSKVIGKIIGLFLGELKTSFALMGALISLLLICAVANNLTESFGKKSVSSATRYACFAYAATLIVSSFSSVCGYVTDTIRDITVLTQSIIPAMSMLLASGGGALLGSMAHPVIFFICSAMGLLIRSVITPLVMLRAACVLFCAASRSSALSELSELVCVLHRNLLALSMTLFSGILGITRIAAASFDNLAARGIKFAVSVSVPVVGGSVAEAMNSVAGSAALLKNAIGTAGVICLFAMFSVPLIKIGALALVYRLAAAFSAPVADSEITGVLRKTGECIDMLFASVACMGVMMIISIASIL